jgi:hypothetical protein
MKLKKSDFGISFTSTVFYKSTVLGTTNLTKNHCNWLGIFVR